MHKTLWVISKYFLPIISVFLFLLILVRYPINDDIGWLFYATKQWMNGKELYTDIIEVNPPLIFMLMYPLVHLGNFFDLNPFEATKIYFLVFVSVLTAFHLRVVFKIFSRFLFFNVYLTAVIIIIFVVPFNDFAQRDHLSILFILPYLFSRYADAFDKQSICRFELCFLGMLAGIGMCLKPYFVIFPFACEVWFVYRLRDWRFLISPQLISLMVVGLLFCCFIIFFHYDYISHLIPIGVATYWTYGQSIAEHNIPFYLAVYAVILVIYKRLDDGDGKQLILYLSVMTGAAMMSFLMQAHFFYQLLPFITLLMINYVLAVYLFFKQYEKFERGHFVFFWGLVFFIIGSSVTYFEKEKALAYEVFANKKIPLFYSEEYTYLSQAVSKINDNFSGEPVYVLSSHVWPSTFISSYTKAIWVSGFSALWPLPAIDMADRYPRRLQKKRISEIASIKNKVISMINKEIEDSNPVAIIVDVSKSPAFFAPGFSYFDFFGRYKLLSDTFDNYYKSDLKIYFNRGIEYEFYIRRDYDYKNIKSVDL